MSFDGDACSAACAWCGRCTYGRYRDADFGDDDTPSVCDLPSCGEPVRVTFAGVGQFCSRDHLELGMAIHARSLTQRRTG
jgi:hypothetical protein